MPKLYIVATPIGNLKDITLRAIEVLREVDGVVAEDTRVTKKLLSHLGISKPVFSYHQFSKKGAEEKVLGILKGGKNLALVTDAGTPGISDPGQRLVREISKFRNLLAWQAGVEILAVPGPSAITAIISVSDIDLAEFLFLGFPPRKKGRQTFFKRVSESKAPVILFESPHRILKTLRELAAVCGDRYANIGRELTKIHEEIFRGKLSTAERYFTGEKQRGEFVIILSNA